MIRFLLSFFPRRRPSLFARCIAAHMNHAGNYRRFG